MATRMQMEKELNEASNSVLHLKQQLDLRNGHFCVVGFNQVVKTNISSVSSIIASSVDSLKCTIHLVLGQTKSEFDSFRTRKSTSCVSILTSLKWE